MGIRINDDIRENVATEYKNGISVTLLMQKYNLGKTTIYRILRENNIDRVRVETPKKKETVVTKMSREQQDEIISCYENGKYIKEIAKEYGITKVTVTKVLKANGIEIKRFIRKSQFSDEEIKKMYELYTSGLTLQDLGNMYRVDKTEIPFLFDKFGYKRRDCSHANRTYTLNENYFDVIDTQNKAYFLGLLYADGCNRTSTHKISISLKKDDKHILESFKTELGSNSPLKLRELSKEKPTFSDQYKLTICNQHMSDILAKWGMVSNKSLILTFPDFLPEDLIPHFLRGYFDGDGHVSGKVYKASIVSTLSFCEHVQNILSQLDIYSKIYNTYNKKTSTRELSVLRKTDAIKFLDYIYSDAELYLYRKHDIYMERYYQSSKVA